MDDFIDALPRSAMLRPDPLVRAGATLDPDDDYLVALALAHEAAFLVSGDRHVLDADGDIACLTPRQALDRLNQP